MSVLACGPVFDCSGLITMVAVGSAVVGTASIAVLAAGMGILAHVLRSD